MSLMAMIVWGWLLLVDVPSHASPRFWWFFRRNPVSVQVSCFASVEQHLDPALRGRPVGVAPVMAETRAWGECCPRGERLTGNALDSTFTAGIHVVFRGVKSVSLFLPL